MTLRTEEISKKHNRRKFDCGKPPLNEFLKKIARQSSQKMATRTYVLIEDEGDPTEILGYYTLLPSTLAFPHAYSGEREHPYRLNVNTIFLNASPTGVCTPGVHVQSIS